MRECERQSEEEEVEEEREVMDDGWHGEYEGLLPNPTGT